MKSAAWDVDAQVNAMHHANLEACITRLLELRRARERADMVARIDRFLAGSPMAGLGAVIVENAERTGVEPRLCPAIAYAESSLGRQNCGSFNPFGMIGFSFGSWEQAIESFHDNVLARWGPVQDAHQLVNPDYCEPPEPYNTNVENLRRSI